jgi:hypothetical protein
MARKWLVFGIGIWLDWYAGKGARPGHDGHWRKRPSRNSKHWRTRLPNRGRSLTAASATRPVEPVHDPGFGIDRCVRYSAGSFADSNAPEPEDG